MINTSKKSQIKLNRRGLTELVLACAFLSLLTFAVWSWQNKGGYVSAMDNSMVDTEAALMPLIMRHPAIMLSAVVTEFVLLLALVLAVVPITWWLRTDAVLANAQVRAMTPLHWLGEKLHLLPPPAEVAEEEEGDYVINESGERVFVPKANPETEMELVPGQDVVMVEQEDGQLVAMVQQEDGTMAPAQMQSKEKKEGQQDKPGAEGDPNDPLLPTPEQSNELLEFGEEEEDDDSLAELVDIDEILNSAFDDESAIDPEREAISRSLEHVDIMDLLGNTRNVLATFKQ